MKKLITLLKTKGNLLIPLSFLGLVFVFFAPFFLKGRIPIPADTVLGLYHPWRDVRWEGRTGDYPYKNFLITDPVRQQYPWRYISLESLKKGNIPLWNPYNGAGEPLLANFQSAPFYPLNLLFFLLPFKTAWGLLVILQMVLGGLFMYLFLDYWKLHRFASFIGSVAFVFSGFSIAWLEWNTIGHTVLWLPLILLSKERLLKKLSWKWILILIFSECSAILAGHLQFLFYLLILSNLYLFVRIIQLSTKDCWRSRSGLSRRSGIPLWRRLLPMLHRDRNDILNRIIRKYLPFLIIGFIVFAITSPQWLPAIEYIKLSSRNLDQMNWMNKEGWFLPWQNLIQFISPDFFGNPASMNYYGVWNYGEMIGYIGLFPLILAFYAILFRRDRKTLFFSFILFGALIFALPTVVAKWPFAANIPFISTSQPTRLIMLVDLSLAVLSALGLDYFLKNKNKQKDLLKIILVFLLIFTGIYVLFGSKFIRDLEISKLAISRRNLYLPTFVFITLLLSYTVSLFNKNNKKLNQLVIVFLIIVSVLDLLRFAQKFTPFTKSELVFPKTETISFLQNKTKAYPWRILGVDYLSNQKRIFPPNISTAYKLYSTDTYDPLIVKNYQEFFGILEWGLINIPALSLNRTIMINNFNSRLVDLLGVKYIAAIKDVVSPNLKFLFKEGETRVYENLEVYPRAFMVYETRSASDKRETARLLLDPSVDLHKVAILEKENIVLNNKSTVNSLEIINYEDNEVEINVNTENKGILILTDVYYPSWKATIDGKETKIIKTDYTFRGVVVPEGSHKVKFYINLI
ncbi:MAG: hypothetical protein UT63_C0003G0024 [Candidatus Gottesmanbacteria bacterium GW2011_GWC2_39_8]|uniref:YfhO family protein n=1 Tax=Candidatus Gottesmanbacteria bacterium GW2011_GWC2_39_8 TaxID=1618450 RepID=A0A0G0Q2G1_9BACT|nr:MAG: hypothetical protein UT63_C0003G0024 [Candidatus Gottesmanbacteria bacterium GW2011_GWC2_39_8]